MVDNMQDRDEMLRVARGAPALRSHRLGVTADRANGSLIGKKDGATGKIDGR